MIVSITGKVTSYFIMTVGRESMYTIFYSKVLGEGY